MGSMRKHVEEVLLAVLVAGLLFSTGATAQVNGLSPIEQLGKELFFDSNLSSPPGQSCAACHAPNTGFTGPDSAINVAGAVYPGAVPTRFGNRKPPTAAYGGTSPVLYYHQKSGLIVGGMFWDGRATGWTLGVPLAEQAQGPFLNPLEQNLASPADVIGIVAASSYSNLFAQVWGAGAFDDVTQAYEYVGRSIAAYERSQEVNPFTSKYDAYLKKQAKLTAQEARGLHLFHGKARCANCHLHKPGKDGEPPLFTDFTYDNLGIPKNPANPFYTEPDFNPAGTNWVDLGLGGFLEHVPEFASLAEDNYGKQKVPTLRNVDKRPSPGFVKAYGHNGYFKSLKEIVHFYNTRDVPGAGWPPPEVPQTVNTRELGNLRLSDADEDAIVEFLKTLTDGYVPAP
jgi:cytochrome c peroxidase